MYGKYDQICYYMVGMANYGQVNQIWQFVKYDKYDHLAQYDHLWSCMVIYVQVWPSMAKCAPLLAYNHSQLWLNMSSKAK